MQTLTATSKITLATFKSFIKANQGNLYCEGKKGFDGHDYWDHTSIGWKKAEINPAQLIASLENYGVTLIHEKSAGYKADYFRFFENETYYGIQIINCLTGGKVAIKK
jgi:phosphoserine aminotransferase